MTRNERKRRNEWDKWKNFTNEKPKKIVIHDEKGIGFANYDEDFVVAEVTKTQQIHQKKTWELMKWKKSKKKFETTAILTSQISNSHRIHLHNCNKSKIKDLRQEF